MNRKTIARVITLILALVLLLGISACVLVKAAAADDTEIIVGKSEAVSVGIIGGADGPTAILVAGNAGAVIAAVVVIAAIVAVVAIIKKRRK